MRNGHVKIMTMIAIAPESNSKQGGETGSEGKFDVKKKPPEKL